MKVYWVALLCAAALKVEDEDNGTARSMAAEEHAAEHGRPPVNTSFTT
jgi:hypothetical protein